MDRQSVSQLSIDLSCSEKKSILTYIDYQEEDQSNQALLYFPIIIEYIIA